MPTIRVILVLLLAAAPVIAGEAPPPPPATTAPAVARTFSKELPEGNYTVTLTLGDAARTTETTVKAESRRLMLENVQTKPGEFVKRTFTVNTRTPKLPDGREVNVNEREKGRAHWDDRLSLEFLGDQADESPEVDVKRAPADTVTVYLAGDSTVTDQTGEPFAGWGQMLPRFFEPSVAVANHAESGRALRSFRNQRRLDKILSTIKPDDWLLIQFGHNDMKEKGEGIGPFTSYKADLKKYVEAARERGAHPVVITSMHRRRFDENGKIVNTFGDYIEAARQAAAEANAPLIDLNAMSKQLYEAWGPDLSKKAFVHYQANTYPNQDKPLKDDTHFNNYGAYELAKCVAEGIRAAKLPLAEHLAEDVKPFDPSKPDPIDSFRVPPSPAGETKTPEGR